MFERFTERARQVVVLAQDEARLLGHNYIGTEHLLLGLLSEEGLAAKVLEEMGIALEGVRAEVAQVVGPGDETFRAGAIPFTPRAKKVLELALKEALALSDKSIGTEHILLGLVRENEGVAARILRDSGTLPEDIAGAVLEFLGKESATAYVESFSEAAPSLESGGLVLPISGHPARRAFFAGWLLFGVSLGLGILVGWAIWGL